MFYWEHMYPDSHAIANGEFLLIHTMFIDYIGHVFDAEIKEYENYVSLVGNVLAAPLNRWLQGGL